MPLLSVSDELKAVMDENAHIIKDSYRTYKLFADSAIKDKLRRMGISTDGDDILPHLLRLEKNKSRHIDKAEIRRTINRHKRRIRLATQKLNLEEE